ncbi:MAG TPA: translation elongation factor Ts [bacterium]|nr:MAG: Elongation factor Ts [Parcubacteria group bacterium ADurb.Bin192]HPN14501.1 translation elongation factor Ts [bacterium]
MADAKMVAELRDKTGAGMMACKKALTEAGDDMVKAVEILKKMGAMKAAQKTAERTTAEGIIVTYLHHNKKLASMLELQCESDFVARNEDFVAFANDLAMQVAAMAPEYVSPDSIPEIDVEKQKQVFVQEIAEDKKPDDIKAKIVQGKLDKWMQDVCLTKQAFFKDEDKTVEQLLTEKIATIGEKIVIARFARWELGKSASSC